MSKKAWAGCDKNRKKSLPAESGRRCYLLVSILRASLLVIQAKCELIKYNIVGLRICRMINSRDRKTAIEMLMLFFLSLLMHQLNFLWNFIPGQKYYLTIATMTRQGLQGGTWLKETQWRKNDKWAKKEMVQTSTCKGLGHLQLSEGLFQIYWA